MTAAPTMPELANDDQRGSHSLQRLVGHSEPKTHENKTLNELHLFAGGGGGILGGILLGHTPVCAVEINERCRKVLLARQRDGILPWFPIWDDVRTFDGTPWRGIADIVAGGFPCQDISTAGKGDGLDGERSGLWKEMVRIIGDVRPRYVFVENSPALTSRGLGRVLGELATLGYDAEWCVLGADSAGAPHRRERLWLLAANADAGIVRTSGPLQNQGRTANLHLCRPRRTGQMEPPWSILAEPCSVAYGMAGLVDELRPYGNGQVPVVAASAWRILEAQLRMPNVPALRPAADGPSDESAARTAGSQQQAGSAHAVEFQNPPSPAESGRRGVGGNNPEQHDK